MQNCKALPFPKLTQLSHGGGCGCKISPGLLKKLLAKNCHQLTLYPQLLVGYGSADDAAVYQLNKTQALVASADFFMPIVDDPFDFGRVAAANALSDIYAMGGRPIMALAILGMPTDKLSEEAIQTILAGGEAICQKANIPIAGGHSIDSLDPIYGLVVLGLVHPNHIKRNNRAQAGDLIILSKPLGIGIMAHAIKKGLLKSADYSVLIDVATQLNSVGMILGSLESVHALTDVTGFGFAGHLLEVCQGATLQARIQTKTLPVFPTAVVLSKKGIAPSAIKKNHRTYQNDLYYADSVEETMRQLILDPQTSGGLIVAVLPSQANQVLDLFFEAGFSSATIVGQLEEGPPAIYFE